LPDEDAITLVLHPPDHERGKRRRARSFPGPQIEAGMMPGTADALTDHESLRERPVIMAAMRIDRENLRSGANQQNILIADVAEQGLSGEVTECDALCEIRSCRRGLFVSHVPLPPSSLQPSMSALYIKLPTSRAWLD
jgi:hypothetical protein